MIRLDIDMDLSFIGVSKACAIYHRNYGDSPVTLVISPELSYAYTESCIEKALNGDLEQYVPPLTEILCNVFGLRLEIRPFSNQRMWAVADENGEHEVGSAVI